MSERRAGHLRLCRAPALRLDDHSGDHRSGGDHLHHRADLPEGRHSARQSVYLSGHTRLLEGDVAKRYWDQMPGKSKAYYRKYCETEDYHKFAVIRTEVDKVVLCKPYAYTKTILWDKDTPAAAS